MVNGWTDARRKRQARLIQQWKPWEQSTGSRTLEGKANSKRNATKHGARSQLIRQVSKLLKKQESMFDGV